MDPYDPGVIRTPLHVHGVRNADEYEKVQKRELSKQKGRGLSTEIHEEPDGRNVIITGGKYCVICDCGDAPSASPTMNIARCLTCGAVYRNLTWPPNIDEVVSILLARPRSNRNYGRQEDGDFVFQTIDELKAENTFWGLPESK